MQAMAEKKARRQAKPSPNDDVSEAQIAVHWQEQSYFAPPKDVVAQANLTDKGIFKRFALDKFPGYYKEFAELLDWYKKWDKIFDGSNPPFWRWFVGGKINASHNCVDRHLAKHRNKTAIHFVPELEHEPIQHLTFQELYVRVNEFAALLRDFCGLKAGDRVTLHMPMVAELPISMLACARLGVIHSQVFSGFSGKACADRVSDSESRVLITMDAYYRGGKLLEHKEKADIAVAEAAKDGHKLEKVLIWQRYPGKYSSQTRLVEGLDFVINDLLPKYRGKRIDPVQMPADASLFLMYTSGTTGKPKGAQHSIGGYLSYVTWTSKYVQDIYIVYGPLALAASSVVYEGVPTHPDPGRPWRIAEELGVNIFHTSPTAIRALRKDGPDEPAKYNYRFKHMTTVGEPIEPAVWKWYFNVVGKKQAVIVDTWWQTETGGFLCTTMPGIHKMKPGSAGPGVPGIHPVIYDEEGRELKAGSGKAGNICIRNPWPGIMQTIWKDADRFVQVYYSRYCKDPKSKNWRDWPYLAGDGAVQTKDGYYRILGRIDDVINVAGHRLGTKEIESAALLVPEVVEAAVVPVADPIKGKVPDLYVALKPGLKPSDELAKKVSASVVSEIGAIARPRQVIIVPDMPKTRSGKIMRRVLAAISNRQDPGDVSTLANPEVVDKIREMAK